MDELQLGSRIGGHADIGETSIMMSLHPDLIRSDLAEAGFQGELTDEFIARLMREGMSAIAPNGILGDARGATAPLGRRLLEALAEQVAEVFRASALDLRGRSQS
jgi:creatinine amidohydrolase